MKSRTIPASVLQKWGYACKKLCWHNLPCSQIRELLSYVSPVLVIGPDAPASLANLHHNAAQSPSAEKQQSTAPHCNPRNPAPAAKSSTAATSICQDTKKKRKNPDTTVQRPDLPACTDCGKQLVYCSQASCLAVSCREEKCLAQQDALHFTSCTQEQPPCKVAYCPEHKKLLRTCATCMSETLCRSGLAVSPVLSVAIFSVDSSG